MNVGVIHKPFLATLFEAKEVGPNGNAIGPLGGLDLTEYREYRLTLNFAGTEGNPFAVHGLFGPAGGIDQVTFGVGSGQIGANGLLRPFTN